MQKIPKNIQEKMNLFLEKIKEELKLRERKETVKNLFIEIFGFEPEKITVWNGSAYAFLQVDVKEIVNEHKIMKELLRYKSVNLDDIVRVWIRFEVTEMPKSSMTYDWELRTTTSSWRLEKVFERDSEKYKAYFELAWSYWEYDC